MSEETKRLLREAEEAKRRTKQRQQQRPPMGWSDPKWRGPR